MKLEEEAYDPAQLDWFDIYRGIAKAGQLLASFELLEASHTHNTAITVHILPSSLIVHFLEFPLLDTVVKR